MAKTATTEIRERWAKVASTIDALGTFVDDTLARMDGVVVESASSPEPETEPFQCSCVGGQEEHTHVPSSKTGTACIRHLLAHQERYEAEYVEAAKAMMGGASVAPASPSTPEAAPPTTTKATTSEIRAAVSAARADPANLCATKAKGLKGTEKQAIADRFGATLSQVGWIDWDVRKRGE